MPWCMGWLQTVIHIAVVPVARGCCTCDVDECRYTTNIIRVLKASSCVVVSASVVAAPRVCVRARTRVCVCVHVCTRVGVLDGCVWCVCACARAFVRARARTLVCE